MTKLKILLVEDKFGQYQNKDGKRYNLIYGTYVVGPRAKDFVEFDTLEDALEFYGLSEYGKIKVYQKQNNRKGLYQDKEGKRYNILSQSFEKVPEGWTAFESEEEAAAAWDLIPIEEE